MLSFVVHTAVSQTVVHQLDIVGRVGPNAALVLTYVIPIDDGMITRISICLLFERLRRSGLAGVLHVKFIPQLRDALLNGIEITGVCLRNALDVMGLSLFVGFFCFARPCPPFCDGRTHTVSNSRADARYTTGTHAA